jgi:hypothetical protein
VSLASEKFSRSRRNSAAGLRGVFDSQAEFLILLSAFPGVQKRFASARAGANSPAVLSIASLIRDPDRVE